MCPTIRWFALVSAAAFMLRRRVRITPQSLAVGTRSLLLLSLATALSAQVPDVRYRMRAAVDDASGSVLGSATIRYRHLGADTLRRVTLRLGDNAYRPGGSGWQGDSRVSGTPGRMSLLAASVDGEPAVLAWAPSGDSSAVEIVLPSPLLDGDSVTLELRWRGQPPALPWRPARRGRHLILAAWYPQVMNTGSRTTVPFPALATFILELDLALDQVVGGTGVPICGDPGWERAAASVHTVVTLQRDWYPSPRDPAARAAQCTGAAGGRKVVTWYAEDVTEVAYGMSPDYRYEEGQFLNRPVRALYERGAERTWGAGLATRRTETAMQWVLEMGGRYPWPHVTIIEGLDRTGAALPMVLVTSLPSQVTILNLQGLLLTEQVLLGGARVFTVGSSAYLTGWFLETLGRHEEYRKIERQILDWDLDRLALTDEPLAVVASGSPCATTFCRRTEFLSYQLRRWAGQDEAMRNLYASLYTEFMLKPTTPGAFQRTARRFIQPRPDTLYVQLLQGALYDDALLRVERARTAEGSWRTTAIVERHAAGIFPRTVQVAADSDTVTIRSPALAPRETLTVHTRTRPRRVTLDPEAEGHDWNMLNNERRFGQHNGWMLLAPNRPTRSYLDSYFTRQSARDRLTLGWAPTLWYNDVAGWTVGARLREDYLGRFELNEFWMALGTARGVHQGRTDPAAMLRLRNPVWLRAPRLTEELEVAWIEGRTEARLGLTRSLPHRLDEGTVRSVGVGVQWFTVRDPDYLAGGDYDDAGTLEGTTSGHLQLGGRWPANVEVTVTGGYAYPNRGAAIPRTGYGRFTLDASVRHSVGARLRLGGRIFAGAVAGAEAVPRQRQIFFAGADPYARFASPFLRSRGALLVRPGFYYHAPGGAGVRGLDPHLSGDRALAATVEVEYAVIPRPSGSVIGSVRVAAFGDGLLGRGDLDPGRRTLTGVADAGLGVRVDHRIGHTEFQTRVDLPLWISRPGLAQDQRPNSHFGLRWSMSFLPAF